MPDIVLLKHFVTLHDMLAASSRKHNVTVWRPSVCLFHRHTHRDSPGGSMQRGQCTILYDNNEDQQTCFD